VARSSSISFGANEGWQALVPDPRSAPADAADRGLVVDAVTAGYGSRVVLDQVSLVARPGEFTGLIGPNGSGKTTLVRVASRGLEPRAGSVSIEGRNPYALRARQAARLVAVVPQEVQPAFEYTVLEIVLMGRSPYLSAWGGGGAQDWAQARRAMAAAQVQHLADRPLAELSGGERQRVILAQALAQDAPVLLLDEPTTHLDIRHVVDFVSLVRALARSEGKAVLAIFHDLNLASAYCDRLYAMDEGRIVASGTPGQVLTRNLVAEVFGIEAEVAPSGATGRPAVIVAPPPTARDQRAEATLVHVVGGAGRAAPIVRALIERGFDVTVGVLHEGDTDASVAERLNLLRVTVPPFSEIDPRNASDCFELMTAASLLVVCDAPFGPGYRETLRLAERAVVAGVPCVMVEQVPIAERDFTGGRASELWARLRERSRVASSPEDVLALAERSRDLA
jgi:iron complex transport system ATP-binding protein